ncbi:TPA: AAA family ATPase [Klebsiella variicola subsp. variicola]|nr:AAA family ATPase [Klebsiella variicola subsp. variicola]
MSNLALEVKNLKSIKSLKIEFPLERGVNVLCGGNGVGKSTVFYCLARLFYSQAYNVYLRKAGRDGSEIKFTFSDNTNQWVKSGKNNNWSIKHNPDSTGTISLNGFFESSFIFGNRFKYANVNMMKKAEVVPISKMERLDDYIAKKLGRILRDDEGFYTDMYIHYPQTNNPNQTIENQHEGKPNPNGKTQKPRPVFALKSGDDVVHYHEMSSGEFIVASLIEYIYDELVNKEKPKNKRFSSDVKLILLDEVEIGLHPSAQQRLVVYLQEVSKAYNACIFISTHSPSVLSKIKKENIFLLRSDREPGVIRTISSCGAAYAIRATKDMNGYDRVILVEDELAKKIIESVIRRNHISSHFVYKVVAVGGWTQVIEMFNEFQSSKFGGVFCKYMAVLDGDVEDDYNNSGRKCFGDLNFLPIKSLEKFVYEGVITNNDRDDYSLHDRIESCFFNSREKTFDDVIKEYIKDNPNHKEKDKSGKNFLEAVKRHSVTASMSEPEVENILCDIAMESLSQEQTNSDVLRNMLHRFFS